MDMVEVVLLIGIYLILGCSAMLFFADMTRSDTLAIVYGLFWPITLLAGLAYVLVVAIRTLIKSIKSWNWHETL